MDENDRPGADEEQSERAERSATELASDPWVRPQRPAEPQAEPDEIFYGE